MNENREQELEIVKERMGVVALDILRHVDKVADAERRLSERRAAFDRLNTRKADLEAMLALERSRR